MASADLQGWFQDPFGLHERRYFSAGRPTKLVRDGQVETYDEPPSTEYDAAAVAAVAGGDGGFASAAAAAPGGYAAAAPRQAALGRGELPGPDGAARLPLNPRTRMIATVAVITAAVIVLVLAFGGEPKPPAGTSIPQSSLAALVTQSAQHTLAERTAQVSLSGTARVTFTGQSTQTIPVTGTGEIDLSGGALALNVVATVSGLSLVENEILVRSNLYLAMIVNGQSFAQVTGGPDWIQMPVQQSPVAYPVASNPLASLTMLEQHGMTVRLLGTQTIAGRSCSGYAITPSEQAMMAAAKADAQLGISSPVMPGQAAPSFEVWFDARQLLCQLSVSAGLNGPIGGTSDSVVLNFSNWGSPVDITAPQPSDTVSYQDFCERSLGAASALCHPAGSSPR